MNMRSRIPGLLLVLAVLFAALPVRADTLRSMPPYYRHWVEEEVPYIISTDERKGFVALHTDLERDNFINAFWESRNPTPGAAYNNYKEEHYRRLAYANEKFGSARYQDGWRTDMGRMYITLGAPRMITPYHLTANVRDLELWFYQGDSPALPVFFNLLFFRPGAGEDYKLYSPRNDGPYRLVTTGQQDNKSAMHILGQQLGPEMQHAALSLYPGEPVDLDTFQPSLDSEILLTKIRNLADQPIERERIIRTRIREATSSSVIVPGPARELFTTVYHDDRNRLTLSYLLRNRDPNPALVGRRKDGSLGYSVNLRSTLFNTEGKLVYEQLSTLEGQLSEPQAASARSLSFGAEDRLPILAGQYQLEIAVRNNLTQEASLFRQAITVTAPSATQLSISPLEVYGQPSPVHDASNLLPFTIAGLRFAPRSVGSASIRQGERLPLVFQIHLPPGTPATPRPASIHLHYLFGQIASGGSTTTESDEEVSADSVDPGGNVLTGHTLETIDLLPGSYRVVVRASGAAGTPPASSILQLRVLPSDSRNSIWTAYGPQQPHLDDIKRGTIAEANGRWDEAADWYSASLREFPSDPRSLRQLVGALSHLGRKEQLAALEHQDQFSKATEPESVILVANALEATGRSPRAISLLESQLHVQPPTPSLLGALATLYERNGEDSRAREYRERAHALASKTN